MQIEMKSHIFQRCERGLLSTSQGCGVDDVLLGGEHAHEGDVVGVPVLEGLARQLLGPVLVQGLLSDEEGEKLKVSKPIGIVLSKVRVRVILCHGNTEHTAYSARGGTTKKLAL